VKQYCKNSSDQGACHRNPRIRPIASRFSRDRQNGMHEARPEIPRGIDGISSGPTQREADGPYQKPDRQGSKRSQIDWKNSDAWRLAAGALHAEDTEDQNESSYDLTSQIRWNGANRWGRAKGRPLCLGIIRDFSVRKKCDPFESAMATDTEGFKCPPLTRPTAKTATNTAIAQPAVITIHPPP